jgi:hypothetical protein
MKQSLCTFTKDKRQGIKKYHMRKLPIHKGRQENKKEQRITKQRERD